MRTLQYCISDLAGRVVGFGDCDSPPDVAPGQVAHVMVEPVGQWPEAPTPTQVLYIANGELYWVETAPLDDAKAAAIAKTYPDVDAIYDVAVGRRVTEYARAEEAARVYLAAAVAPAVVSDYITGHATNNPTGQQQSNEWAARQIIERADAFRWAELQMRNVRFARQADMRAAGTPEELAQAVAEWEGFLSWLRLTLDL